VVKTHEDSQNELQTRMGCENTYDPSLLSNNLDRSLRWSSEIGGSWWAVHQESSHLHLSGGIESHKTDVSIWESLGAGLDLSNNLGSIGASEHWQLPHGPVSVVLVSRGAVESAAVLVGHVSEFCVGELEAWGPSIADNVVHLLGDIFIIEWWEEREGLEELVVDWSPNLEVGGLLGAHVGNESWLDSLGGDSSLLAGSQRSLDHGSRDSGSHCISC
jgi:hypothetical protein